MDRPALWTQFCLNAWLWSFGCRRRSCGCWWCLPSGWGGPALFRSFGPVYLVPTVTRILPPCGRSLEHGVGTRPVAGPGARQTAGRVLVGGELGAQEGERETWASSGSPAVSYHVGLTAGKTCRGCLGPRFPESAPLSLRSEDQAAMSVHLRPPRWLLSSIFCLEERRSWRGGPCWDCRSTGSLFGPLLQASLQLGKLRPRVSLQGHSARRCCFSKRDLPDPDLQPPSGSDVGTTGAGRPPSPPSQDPW